MHWHLHYLHDANDCSAIFARRNGKALRRTHLRLSLGARLACRSSLSFLVARRSAHSQLVARLARRSSLSSVRRSSLGSRSTRHTARSSFVARFGRLWLPHTCSSLLARRAPRTSLTSLLAPPSPHSSLLTRLATRCSFASLRTPRSQSSLLRAPRTPRSSLGSPGRQASGSYTKFPRSRTPGRPGKRRGLPGAYFK